VDDPSVFQVFLAVPEEPGAHVVLLGDGKLLMSSGAPKTAALMRSRGYEPVLVDIGEFEKLEGSVTCLSVRLRGV
jgi:dimethylargininase